MKGLHGRVDDFGISEKGAIYLLRDTDYRKNLPHLSSGRRSDVENMYKLKIPVISQSKISCIILERSPEVRLEQRGRCHP